MNREPSQEAKALAEALYEASAKTGAEQETATLRAADMYEAAGADGQLWAQRLVRACLVAQGLAS